MLQFVSNSAPCPRNVYLDIVKQKNTNNLAINQVSDLVQELVCHCSRGIGQIDPKDGKHETG